MAKKAILLLDLLLLSGTLLAAPLARWMMTALPPCPLASLGYQCVTCGGTRCILALSRLELTAAWHLHPPLCLLVGYGLLVLLALHLGYLANNRLCRRLFHGLTDYRAIIAWAGFFALFGLLRNF